MNANQMICDKCTKIIYADEVKYHRIRRGYSAAYFPLFHFENVPLCQDCLEKQGKLEILEKILAIIALLIVGYFMAIGFITIFSTGR